MEIAPNTTFDPLPKERKYDKAVPGLMKRVRDLYEALLERFGDRGLDLIRDVSRGYGERVAAGARSHVEPGVRGVGLYVLRVFDMVGGAWTVTRCDDEEMVIEVSHCPYPFREDEVCQAHTAMEKAMVEGLDPDLEYFIRRSIPRGDAVCEHVVRRRDKTKEE